jgi:hypothetical protein
LGGQAARWSCVLWLVLAKSLLVELWFMQLVCAGQFIRWLSCGLRSL